MAAAEQHKAAPRQPAVGYQPAVAVLALLALAAQEVRAAVASQVVEPLLLVKALTARLAARLGAVPVAAEVVKAQQVQLEQE